MVRIGHFYFGLTSDNFILEIGVEQEDNGHVAAEIGSSQVKERSWYVRSWHVNCGVLLRRPTTFRGVCAEVEKTREIREDT